MPRKVTIKDVAREAGVALGTVSNYLNRTAPVADETAARIREAISALGYRVNLGARGLRSNRTQSVGLVLPNITNPFYAEVARAVEQVLWENELQTLLCDSWHQPERERKHLGALAERRVDGVLVIYCDELDSPLEAVDRLSVPAVFVDRGVQGRRSVTSDNRLGGALAARHLAELGHRRVGLLAGQASVRNVAERIEGFRDELARHGLRLEEECIVHGPQALELGYQAERLMRLKKPPSAVFCTNDIVAIGAWRKLLELGYRIPADVSLVGFDDVEMSRLLVPPLTTVAQDKAGLGREAAALLLRAMADPGAPVTAVTVAPALQVCGSTGPLRPSGPRPRARSGAAQRGG